MLCTSRSSKGESLLNDLVLYPVEAKSEKNNIEDDYGTEESIKKIVVINSKQQIRPVSTSPSLIRPFTGILFRYYTQS